jgi:hypothetical protein
MSDSRSAQSSDTIVGERGGRGWSVVALVCVVLAALLTTPAAVAYWGQRTRRRGSVEDHSSVTVTPREKAESCSSRLAGVASAGMSNTTMPVSELPGLISS